MFYSKENVSNQTFRHVPNLYFSYARVWTLSLLLPSSSVSKSFILYRLQIQSLLNTELKINVLYFFDKLQSFDSNWAMCQ